MKQPIDKLIQRYKDDNKPIKLNLGCYDKPIYGYINIDIRDDTAADCIDDVFKLETIKNETIDVIYLSHVFEHTDFNGGKNAMKRYYEVLKPGGILRISVPDMDATFAHYFYWKDLSLLHAMLWGSQKHHADFHMSGYDENTLTKLFADSGFINIKKWDWSLLPDTKFLDDYSQAYYPFQQKYGLVKGEATKIGKLMSLNLEGTK